MSSKDIAIEEWAEITYAMAYQLYVHKEYEEACHLFRLLLQSNPLNAKYLKGFGACLQQLKIYREALYCYIGAQNLNREKPDLTLFIHAADCYWGLNQVEDSLDTLEKARMEAKKQNNQNVLNHVNLMKRLWTASLNNKSKEV